LGRQRAGALIERCWTSMPAKMSDLPDVGARYFVNTDIHRESFGSICRDPDLQAWPA
jgi:hypothetical protein